MVVPASQLESFFGIWVAQISKIHNFTFFNPNAMYLYSRNRMKLDALSQRAIFWKFVTKTKFLKNIFLWDTLSAQTSIAKNSYRRDVFNDILAVHFWDQITKKKRIISDPNFCLSMVRMGLS